MPWGQRFLDELKKSRLRPRYRLETAPALNWMPGVSIRAHSHVRWNGVPCAISLQGSSIRAGTLNVGDWTHTTGDLQVGLAAYDPRRLAPRGSLVRLLVGFEDFDESEFEPVFLGQIQDVRRTGGQWQLGARSILGALQSRLASTLPGLFDNLVTTELVGGYTAGASTELAVLDRQGLESLVEGGFYLVLVTPDSGDPFFVTASTLTDNVLSGLTEGVLGTTAADASSGNTVQICAYFPTDPVNFALFALTSTGAGTNGPYDLAPQSWGIGLPFGYVDEVDALLTRSAIIPAVGDPWWNIYSAQPQPNAMSWLQSVLSPAGIWVGERQGMVTVRAVHDVGDIVYEVGIVHDRDIVAIRSYSAWTSEQPVEYGQLTVESASGETSQGDAHYDSRPALADRRIELPYVGTNESEWLGKVRARLLDWYTKVGEVFEVELIGFKYAHLSPGDHVLFVSRFLKSRYDVEGLSLVLSCQPNWFGASTILKCLHLRDVNQFG